MALRSRFSPIVFACVLGLMFVFPLASHSSISATALHTIQPATIGMFNACGESANNNGETIDSTFGVIRSCTLTLPEAGVVYLSANASVAVIGENSDVNAVDIRLGIDSPSGIEVTNRRLQISKESGVGGDGMDKPIATSLLQSLSAGTHTFSFLAARQSGADTILLYDPSLSVLYFPQSAAQIRTCDASLTQPWATTQTSFQPVQNCSLTLPSDGYVYASASAAVGLADTAYEAQFRLGIDGAGSVASSERRVNIYAADSYGTDEALMTSAILPISAGAHELSLAGRRSAGSGTVQLSAATLSVIYFPTDNAVLKSCSATGTDTWTNATPSYTTIRSCSIDVSTPAFAFIDANASVGLSAAGSENEWDGQFRIGMDDPSGLDRFDRFVNAYDDGSGDGTDLTVAASGILSVGKGSHTFYFVGKQYGGDGAVRASSASLSVLVPIGPTISTIPNQRLPLGAATAPLAFTVGDATFPATDLTVTADSANTILVPNSQITLAGSGAERTVTVQPASDQLGTTIITLTVSNGARADSTSFQLTVTDEFIVLLPVTIR